MGRSGKAHRAALALLALGWLAVPTLAASITGTVETDGLPSTPLANARVTLFDGSMNFFREVRAAADGSFTFDSVPIGNYQIGASALRREYAEDAVVVATADVTHSFQLGLESNSGQWTVIGTTTPEFLDATDIGILLTDGRIFYCHDTTDPILFDPASGTRTFPSGSPTPQGCQNASLLSDGKVIMMGGQTPANPGSFTNAVRWVKTWAPTPQAWRLLAEMQHPTGRWYPGMARLADGSLLVMGGGQCCNAARTNTCERFDLATQTWAYTGSMASPTEFPPTALLYTGEVLATWWPPQLYNPTTGQWRLTGNFNQSNRLWPGHSDHSLVVLADGRALAVGVTRGPNNNNTMGEIFDPDTETWTLTSNPGLIRLKTEVVQLPDGRIFVGGGETEVVAPPVDDVLGIVRWCDLYDPESDSWRRVADMMWHREYHGVSLLVPDGRVVMTGGTRIKFQVGPTSADIEAFSPPYLFRGIRPEIVNISSSELPRGSQVRVELTLETELTSLVLIGTQTTTHWVDGGVPRRLVLPVEQTGAMATAVLPTNPNVVPLGHYMLFAMVDDIPSVARIVKIVQSTGNCDGDGDQDLVDFASFQRCFAGLGPSVAGACACADLDGDGDVDLADFTEFGADLTGPLP